MATVLNTVNISQSGGNTGVGAFTLDIKNIIGAIILPKGTTILNTDLASVGSFIAALQAKTLAPQASRAYPVHGFEEIKDSSESETVTTLGYGGRSVTREGRYDWAFQYLKGGVTLAQKLRKFNNKEVDVIFIDASYLAFGVKTATGMKGINQDFIYSAPFKANDGSKSTVYSLRFVFKPDFLDTLAYVQLAAGDFDTIVGLQDVTLSSGGARVAGVSLVKGAFDGNIDLHSVYTSELAVAGLWTAKDATTGNGLTITSVAENTNIGGWTITVDITDPDYSAARPVIISLAAPSVLNTAGILAIESNSFTTPN